MVDAMSPEHPCGNLVIYRDTKGYPQLLRLALRPDGTLDRLGECVRVVDPDSGGRFGYHIGTLYKHDPEAFKALKAAALLAESTGQHVPRSVWEQLATPLS